MCGRFTLTTSEDLIADIFRLSEPPSFAPRYNIAPTQQALAIRNDAGEAPIRRAVGLRWGLVPAWARDPTIGNRMINARAETLAEKPSFRSALRRRRCIVVADGFYEWKTDQTRTGRGKKGPKTPHWIHPTTGVLLAFAGLWETWEDTNANILETCTIITTPANATMQTIHQRMPAILAPVDFDQWLDVHDDSAAAAARAQTLLAPWRGAQLQLRVVSTHVNRPGNDDARCVEPI